uniref:Uncharacterized protein n=1 Tax=Parastrongyloides trichosuri TaxID=131310 RepID=A0A0N4ZPB2_PARTI
MTKLLIFIFTIISFIYSFPIQEELSHDNVELLDIGKTISGSPIVSIEHGESNPVKEDSVIEKDSETDPIDKFFNGSKRGR